MFPIAGATMRTVYQVDKEAGLSSGGRARRRAGRRAAHRNRGWVPATAPDRPAHWWAAWTVAPAWRSAPARPRSAPGRSPWAPGAAQRVAPPRIRLVGRGL